MTVCGLCSMEKCVRIGRSRRRITVQVIVDIIIWFTVGVPNLYLFVAGVPYDRGFFCDDTSIQYPNKPETIGTPLLVLLGFAITLTAILIIEVLNCIDRKCRSDCQPTTSLPYIIKCYAVFLVGFAVEQMFVEVVKNTTGALRPAFIDICRPQYNTSMCPGYITDYECTRTESAKVIRLARQSFPSGHAAFSMYIAVYFCFYIQHRLQISFSRIMKFLLQMALLLASSVCGFLRVSDHKHHLSDVIAGFFIGALIAALSYKTLAERIMVTSDKTEHTFSVTDEPDSCCTCCECNATDAVTPTSLLSAEYLDGNTNNHPLNRVKLHTPSAQISHVNS